MAKDSVKRGSTPIDAHRHPASSGQGDVRVERAYASSDITEAGDEGCAEHYFQRFVQVDKPPEAPPDLSLLREAVLGSVILTPRFRSPWKRRFP